MFWIKTMSTTDILSPLGLPSSPTSGAYKRSLFVVLAVLMCIRAMLHDETEYPEPFAFAPERWILGDGEKEPLNSMKIAFGFGRRCVFDIMYRTADLTLPTAAYVPAGIWQKIR
jgi:Cytochrome P450